MTDRDERMPPTPDHFRELCDRVASLNALLQDPQPGLVTWCALYASHMKWIAAYWENN